MNAQDQLTESFISYTLVHSSGIYFKVVRSASIEVILIKYPNRELF